jgi:ATP-dependent DNA helicase RecG
LEKYFDKVFKAIAYERKQGFCNSKGLNYHFCEFIQKETNQLIENFTLRDKTKIILKKINHNFYTYDELSVSDRKKRIDELYDFIDQLNFKDEKSPEKKPTSVPLKVKEEITPYIKPNKNGESPTNNDNWENKSVQYIKGIGPKLAENLATAGILTIDDLFHYYPRKHLNYANRTKIKECRIGSLVTLWGVIKDVTCFTPPTNRNITILSVTIDDGTGKIKASWFYGSANRFMQEQYKKRFPVGAQALLSGMVKIDKFTRKFAVDKPEIEILGDVDIEETDSVNTNRIVPVYPLVEGLNLKWLRKTIKIALDIYSKDIIDPLPKWLLEHLGLFDLATSIREFHFPGDTEILEQARHRLVFDELFYLQLGFAYKRKQEQLYLDGISLKNDGIYVNKFLEILPFQLTGAQQRVFKEISVDLQSTKPMSRLVQGDVGSGKTVVALLTLLVAVQNGFQGALMAPTEILADQHFRKFKDWLEPMGLKVDFLVGNQTKKVRRQVLESIENGETHITVGTHALIQEEVNFKKLGLVIVDEQHRFGVIQRSTLRNKGNNPEILTMTATPIPRTLALTLHGDLDVSIIDELPPGRKPVETLFIRGQKRGRAWDLVRDEVEKGRQVYIVFPLIEESEKLAAKAATVEAKKLQDKIFPEFKIGLLHGQMKASEKDVIMQNFIKREIDILVSTTVIEVGVDVPNATVMIIENAERFGLSQLHQLRGRVGRGADKSFCLLMSDKSGEISEQRMQIMTETNDGFIIAEQDLKLRGPGEFLGTRQSGLPDLILADLVRDTVILEEARNAARMVIEKDNELKEFQHQLMKKELYKYFRNNKDYLGS